MSFLDMRLLKAANGKERKKREIDEEMASAPKPKENPRNGPTRRKTPLEK